MYVGFTDDIIRRVKEHKSKTFQGFTSKYDIDKLIYFETALTADKAQIREKRIKKWNRQWKIDLIERHNPEWKDLSESFCKFNSNDDIMAMLFDKNLI